MLKNLKKSVVIILVFVAGMNMADAQQSENIYTPDGRLYECMSKAQIEEISTAGPELILYYNYYLDHSYYIASLKSDKPVTGTDIHTVPVKGKSGNLFSENKYIPGKFNPLKYDFIRNLDDYTTYVWKEAGIAIVFYPQRHFQSQYQAYLKENHVTHK